MDRNTKNENRRSFIKKAGLISASILTIPLVGFSEENKQVSFSPLDNSKIDDDKYFWDWIRNEYTVSSTIINLNNGAVSPQPRVVQEVFEQYNRTINQIPSKYMWSFDHELNSVRKSIAELAGCSPEEIAFNRNTTEALNTIISGLNLNKGDEIIVSEQDYSTVMKTWEQREKRDGIVLKWITMEMPAENKDKIINTYLEAITKKTKVIMLTHVNNINGNIIPVKEIIQKARAINPEIKMLVDGAHAFGHLHFKISDLDCDYYGASLHKWLCAPFGTGLLYVKKSEIKNIWPLFPYNDPQSEDIKKFETLGTYAVHAELAISKAIEFHNIPGSERKYKRLVFLKNYWMEKVKDIPNVELKSSFNEEFCGGIASICLKNMSTSDFKTKLEKDFFIHTSSKSDKTGKLDCVRITPHIYTKIEELDRFVEAVRALAAS